MCWHHPAASAIHTTLLNIKVIYMPQLEIVSQFIWVSEGSMSTFSMQLCYVRMKAFNYPFLKQVASKGEGT